MLQTSYNYLIMSEVVIATTQPLPPQYGLKIKQLQKLHTVLRTVVKLCVFLCLALSLLSRQKKWHYNQHHFANQPNLLNNQNLGRNLFFNAKPPLWIAVLAYLR